MPRPPKQVVSVTVDEVDRHTIHQFRADLDEAVRAFAIRTEPAPADAMVVDLRDVTFLDSSGVRALVDAERQLLMLDGCLEVLVAPGPVTRILQVSGVLDRWLAAN